MEPGWPFGGRPKPRKPWALWKAGRLMGCEINEVRDSRSERLGVEVRVYVARAFHYSRLHPIRLSAYHPFRQGSLELWLPPNLVQREQDTL